METRFVSLPPNALLLDVYRHMPFMVIHVTTDGIVLHCNPETCKITGYHESELLGKNLWATLFPGKLFAQVPRFISLLEPSPLLKDMPMALRTKSGSERVIGFSRYIHTDVTHENDAAPRTFICIGVDLTDRLLQADRAQLPETNGSAAGVFGPHIGNAGAIDGEVVTPIAISPKPTGVAGPCPIEQVREGLARVETHIHCVKGAFNEGETQTLAALSHALGIKLQNTPPSVLAQGTMGFELLALRDEMHLRASRQSLGAIQARVDELLSLHRPELG